MAYKTRYSFNARCFESKCIAKDGFIKVEERILDKKGKPITFNASSKYEYKGGPKYNVKTRIGLPKEEIANSIHLEFANLDYGNVELILKFCSKYGLLGYYDLDSFYKCKGLEPYDILGDEEKKRAEDEKALWVIEHDSPEKHVNESIEYFIRECKTFQFILELCIYIKKKNIKKLIHTFKKYEKSIPKVSKGETESSDTINNDDLYNSSIGIVMDAINTRIRRVRIQFPMDDPINKSKPNEFPEKDELYAPSLISAIYLMLRHDIIGGINNEICEACGKVFRSSRIGNRFCSDSCRVNLFIKNKNALKKIKKSES